MLSKVKPSTDVCINKNTHVRKFVFFQKRIFFQVTFYSHVWYVYYHDSPF